MLYGFQILNQNLYRLVSLICILMAIKLCLRKCFASRNFKIGEPPHKYIKIISSLLCTVLRNPILHFGSILSYLFVRCILSWNPPLLTLEILWSDNDPDDICYYANAGWKNKQWDFGPSFLGFGKCIVESRSGTWAQGWNFTVFPFAIPQGFTFFWLGWIFFQQSSQSIAPKRVKAKK